MCKYIYHCTSLKMILPCPNNFLFVTVLVVDFLAQHDTSKVNLQLNMDCLADISKLFNFFSRKLSQICQTVYFEKGKNINIFIIPALYNVHSKLLNGFLLSLFTKFKKFHRGRSFSTALYKTGHLMKSVLLEFLKLNFDK